MITQQNIISTRNINVFPQLRPGLNYLLFLWMNKACNSANNNVYLDWGRLCSRIPFFLWMRPKKGIYTCNRNRPFPVMPSSATSVLYYFLCAVFPSFSDLVILWLNKNVDQDCVKNCSDRTFDRLISPACSHCSSKDAPKHWFSCYSPHDGSLRTATQGSSP